MTTTSLKVTSHVARDLLASAAAFKSESSVVWEYVVNSLQYMERGLAPKVNVEIGQHTREIVVSDNAQGMSFEDLKQFLRMHGENRDRLAGRPGRGKFGTGKSAAFGIANSLRVDTVRNGLRNVVVLTRDMIEASSGEGFEPDWKVRNASTTDPNGTTIVISDVILPRLRTAPVIEYLERHLQAFRTLGPEVAVNDHVCAYHEPEIDSEEVFKPAPEQAAVIGNVELVVRVARAPLPEEEQGIAVTAGPGNLIGIETGGVQAKESGSYLFGFVDVPAIEASPSRIAPYDSSRNLKLNPLHPVVAVLVGFIGSKLEKVRADLARRSREARKDEQTRRLADEADKIAEVLNEDFKRIRDRLRDIRSASAKSGSTGARFGNTGDGGDSDDGWVSGAQELGTTDKDLGRRGNGKRGGREAPNIKQRGERDDSGSSTVDPVGGASNKRIAPRGGFKVQFKPLGREYERSHYDSGTLTIWINLEHPVVAAALGFEGSTEDPAFRRLAYEIAFTEYAMGIGDELTKQDPGIPADDLLFEVRATINRVAVAAAALYR